MNRLFKIQITRHYSKSCIVLLSLGIVSWFGCRKDFSTSEIPSTALAKPMLTTDALLETKIYDLLAAYHQAPNKSRTGFTWFLNKAGGTTIPDSVTEKVAAKIYEQTQLANRLGGEGYLDYLRQNQLLSHSVCDYMQKMYGIIRLNTDKGKLLPIDMGFALKTIEQEFENDAKLTAQDKESLTHIAATAKASYRFLHDQIFYNGTAQNNTVQSRGPCDVINWGAAGLISGGITALLIHTGVIDVGTALIIGMLPGAVWVAAAAIATVALYALACSLFYHPEVPDCTLPPSIVKTLIDCNTLELSAYGGRDMVSYDWSRNANLNFPNGDVTSNNTIRATVPNRSTGSVVLLVARCKENTVFEKIDRFSISELVNAPPPFVSIIDGPRTGRTFAPLRFSTNVTSHGPYVLSWSIRGSSGGGITPNSYWADITFWRSGQFTIVAKMTNTCTGQILESEWTVTIQ